MTRIDDENLVLVEPDDSTVPTDHYPRRDPREPDPDEVPELSWRGVQEWICGIVAAWRDAPGWYVLDWGDGRSSLAHPRLRIRRHSLTTNSACDNLSSTVTARELYRDGTTSPVRARSTVYTRGRGDPRHEFTVSSSDPAELHAYLSIREQPYAYSLAWDPDTELERLPDGEYRATHTYAPGPSRRPVIGVLDRTARRLRWFGGPVIHKDKRHEEGGAMIVADFAVKTTWNNGYTGEYTVKNNTKTPESTWVLEFRLAKPAEIADYWGAGTLSVKRSTDKYTVYQITSTQPLQGEQAVTATMRVEPGKNKPGEDEPVIEPTDCTINGQPCQAKPDPTPPSVPTDLKVTAVGHKTVSLEWKPSTDNVGVASYEVDVRPAPATGKPTSVPGNRTATTIGGLAPTTEYTIRLRAYDYAHNRSDWSGHVTATTNASPPPPTGWPIRHAPYVDLAGWPTPQLAAYTKESNAKNWTLAFIQAAGPGDSMPSWGGYRHQYGITHNYNQNTGQYEEIPAPFEYKNITEFAETEGHNVVISFGGANGTEISQAAKDMDEAYRRYKSVVDAYQVVRHLDFDIEGAAEYDLAANERRAAAVAKLQQEYSDLQISLTLPVNPTGLTNSGIGVLQAMLDGGVSLALVNIMCMEFGTSFPGDMGTLTIQAIDSTVTQIAPILDVSGNQAYRMLGACPMLGKNNNGRVWTKDHAKKLLDHATAKNLGSLTHWEATRDKNACFGETWKCTGISQTEFEFTTRFFAPYVGGGTDQTEPAQETSGKSGGGAA